MPICDRLWTAGVDKTDTGASPSEQLHYAEVGRLTEVEIPDSRTRRGNKWDDLMVDGARLLKSDPAAWNTSDWMRATEIVATFQVRILEHDALNPMGSTRG